MLCSLFPLCSKAEKMISKEIMHLQYPIKNHGYALVQPLPHASLNLQFCKAFLKLIFVTTCTLTYQECPFQGEGEF